MVHWFVQQSAAPRQLSPAWPQNDEAWHVPFEQSLEQQASPLVHALPSVRQVVLSGAQVPFTQLWLQQFPFEVHAALSEVHAGYLQAPPMQSPLQQSLAVEHAAPSPRQLPWAPPPSGPNTVGMSAASTTFGAASSPTPVAPSSVPTVASAERPPSPFSALLESFPHPVAHAKAAASAIQASTRREPIVHSSKRRRRPEQVRCRSLDGERLLFGFQRLWRQWRTTCPAVMKR
jgi:hypothetical protein